MASQRKGFSHLLMACSLYQGGRDPIGQAVLKNGKGELVHVMQFADGECVILNRDINQPKCRIKCGEIIKAGKSSVVSWQPSQDTMDNIVANRQAAGFTLTLHKHKQGYQLPLVELRHAQAA